MSDRPSRSVPPGESRGLLDTSVVIDIDVIDSALLPDETAISVITLAELTAVSHNMLTSAERADGWMLLFDGTSLNGWGPRVDARWEVSNGTISGVFIRCPADGPITQGNAFEVNIYDTHDTWPTGSVNEVAKIQSMPNTTGRWNTFEISADGDHLMVKLNGETTVDARSDRHTHGPIALQYNASGQVRFRNVKIKTLD